VKYPHRLSIILVLAASCAIAQPTAATAPGIPNFHQVNDRIYRGGQPTNKAWDALAHLGIRTVVDLRLENEHPTFLEARAVEAAGMHYVSLPMNYLSAPTDKQIAKALALLDADFPGAIFIHCRRGADRTGTVIACYRISHDHWANQKALVEAKSLGMSWLEWGMQNYVTHFQPPAPATLPEPPASQTNP